MSQSRVWRATALALLLAVLGWIGYCFFVVRPRERAFAILQERVKSWGGDVFPDRPFNRTIARLRPWIGRDLASRISGDEGMVVSARGVDATKGQLTELLAVPRIHRVNLSGSRNLDDDWINGIDTTSSMFQLCVPGTGITDRSVPKILEMQGLASLDLADTAISDAAVERFRTLPEIRELFVGGANIKVVRLIDSGVFDDSGKPAIHPAKKLRVRGRIKMVDLPFPPTNVRVMVRIPGDAPAWRSRPYGWNASVMQEGKLVEEASGIWSFSLDVSGIPAGQSSVEVWVQEPIAERRAILYR